MGVVLGPIEITANPSTSSAGMLYLEFETPEQQLGGHVTLGEALGIATWFETLASARPRGLRRFGGQAYPSVFGFQARRRKGEWSISVIRESDGAHTQVRIGSDLLPAIAQIIRDGAAHSG